MELFLGEAAARVATRQSCDDACFGVLARAELTAFALGGRSTLSNLRSRERHEGHHAHCRGAEHDAESDEKPEHDLGALAHAAMLACSGAGNRRTMPERCSAGEAPLTKGPRRISLARR